MELKEAIQVLKDYVKYSCIPGQKHLDFSLVNIDHLPEVQKAMEVAQSAIIRGEMTRDDLLKKVNLV